MKHNTKLLKSKYLPEHYTEVEQPFYEGKGNHSVSKLEEICEGYKEYSHQADIAFFECERKASSLTQQVEELTAELSERRREIDALQKVIKHDEKVNENEISELKSEVEELKKEREIYREVLDETKILERINFWQRLEMFISNVQVNDLPSEEEKEMILNVTKAALNSPSKQGD